MTDSSAPAAAPRLAANLSEFTFERLLMNEPGEKRCALLGKVGGQVAILKLERAPFAADAVDGGIPALVTDLLQGQTAVGTMNFENDIYSKYACVAPDESLIVDLTCPATDKHISKLTKQPVSAYTETPADYAAVHKPLVDAIPAGRTAWVINVVEKKKEVERMIFEDADAVDGFVMHPDLKWDAKDASALYCLAIVHRRDLRSMRELRGEHLPLLRNLRDKGCAAIEASYGVPRSKLRVFLHYVPSYYHLHVHFSHVERADFGQYAGKAHLLDDVITSLEIASDFYERATLTYVLQDSHDLAKAHRAHSGEAL